MPTTEEKQIVELLLKEAQKIYELQKARPIETIEFVKEKNINDELCDLQNKPYLFVLACIMDRQISAERAWRIPHQVCQHFNVHSLEGLAAITEEEYVSYFEEENIHRFNATMGRCFYKAVQRIKNVYNGDASKIWAGKPSSATVVYRFLCFEGVGIKIATMATNILSRDFKIKLKDLVAIDVSPDIQVCRILCRLGLTESNDRVATIYKAKEISPNFPGLIDLVCWEYGRNFCHPQKPNCDSCPLNSVCQKVFE